MKTLLILGGGTAGTIMAQKMSKHLDLKTWKIIVVDKEETHYYQPGFLFIPFGTYKAKDVIKPKKRFIPSNVEIIYSDIEIIEPDNNTVMLVNNQQEIKYDYLIVATGTRLAPEETPGLMEEGWHKNIFDFYTIEGAVALHEFLSKWEGGKMVVSLAEMPIKCPVAPLEFVFLADWYFKQRGMRDKVEIIYATPLPGAFTKARSAAVLGGMMEEKNILIETDFNISEVNNSAQTITSYDGRELAYDVLVSIPVNMGADVIERSGMGDELNYVPTDKFTLQSNKWENVFVIGDASNIPTSKAGSVVHFMAEAVTENMLSHMKGQPMQAKFDGHANCYIESGHNKAILIDFNYDVEPLPGTYPMPVLGPFSLLKESYINHLGKLVFRWMYWNLLLKDGFMPVSNKMSMVGKKK
ncbi:MAG: NAD(P)/FAD-dependent oxidoreductase [Anaerolineaceae bacterium]|nr:NAD(P)/FAD-dependent oxidoreductase [Anaerolineaceae bacterium]